MLKYVNFLLVLEGIHLIVLFLRVTGFVVYNVISGGMLV